MASKIVLENVIVSYPHLFVPRAAKGSDTPRYSVSLILPTDVDWSPIKEAIRIAELEKWPNGSPAGLQTQIKKVLDGPHKGKYAIAANASIDHKPQVVDQDIQPIMDTSQIFAGVIANAACAVFGYDVGKPGVGWGINFLQLVRNTGNDIIRLDNSQSADEVFGKVAGAPPVASAAPAGVVTEQAAPQGTAPTGDASAPPEGAVTEADPWD